MNNAIFEKLAKRIDGYKDLVIELQKKLIATPAIGPENGGDGEYKKALVLEPILRSIYDEVNVIKVPDSRVSNGFRPNIIAKLHGISNERTIWIMAHMDIVPEGELKDWKTPPLEATVIDGKIFGRGSEDNNQGLISSILAAKALKDEGIKPTYTLGAMFVSDEEVNNEYGAKYLIKNRPELFGANDMVIVPDVGNSDGSEIELAEKSVIWFQVRTVGKQTHGSTPEKGINAHKAAAYLICKMDTLYETYPESDPLFLPPISTFEPTMKLANVKNINTIPGEDVVCFDCRLLPCVDVKKFMELVKGFFHEIEAKFGVKISNELPSNDIAPPATPIDSPLVKMLTRAITNVRNIAPHCAGIGGQTVASHFRGAGFHCVAYSKLDEVAHQPNEYCIIDNLLGDAKVWAHIFTDKQ